MRRSLGRALGIVAAVALFAGLLWHALAPIPGEPLPAGDGARGTPAPAPAPTPTPAPADRPAVSEAPEGPSQIAPEPAPAVVPTPPAAPAPWSPPPGTSAFGRVVGPDGAPLAGIHVRAVRGDAARGGSVDVGAITDADGRYAITVPAPPSIPGHEIGVGIHLPSPTRYAVREPRFVRVPEGGEAPDFVLKLLPAVRLRIVDAATQRPLPDATVERQEVERDGEALRVYLPVIRNREGILPHPLLVSAPGYVPRTVNAAPPEHGVADVDAPVLLEPGVRLSGRLRTAAGEALRGSVVAEPLGPRNPQPTLVGTRALADGSFTLPLVVPGTCRLVALVSGRSPLRQTVTAALDSPTLDLVLSEPGLGSAPPARGHRWADRWLLPWPIDDEPTRPPELLQWIEEVADAEVVRDWGVDAALAVPRGRGSVRFAVTSLADALSTLACYARLACDCEQGRIGPPLPPEPDPPARR